MLILSVSSSTAIGMAAEPPTCEEVLKSAEMAVKSQEELVKKLEDQVAHKDQQLQEQQNHDKIIYRQPVPWLLLGGLITIINPVIGIPVMAVGAARAL